MNCGIFDAPRLLDEFDVLLFFGASSAEGCSTALGRADLSPLPFCFECQTASDAAAWPPSMNGFGREPLPAVISSMPRPEATERSSSVTGLPLSRAYASRCLIRSQRS